MQIALQIVVICSSRNRQRNLFANCQENMVICFRCHLCCLNAIFHALNGTVVLFSLFSSSGANLRQSVGHVTHESARATVTVSHVWLSFISISISGRLSGRHRSFDIRQQAEEWIVGDGFSDSPTGPATDATLHFSRCFGGLGTFLGRGERECMNPDRVRKSPFDW